MVHQCQRLPFGLEASQHLLRVHPGLDHLNGHPTVDGFLLLGHPDRAHAAFADLFEQLVGADDGAGLLGRWRLVPGRARLRFGRRGNGPELFMRLNEQLDTLAQIAVVRTGGAEVGITLVRQDLERGQEEFTQFVGFGVHGEPVPGPSTFNAEMVRE